MQSVQKKNLEFRAIFWDKKSTYQFIDCSTKIDICKGNAIGTKNKATIWTIVPQFFI